MKENENENEEKKKTTSYNFVQFSALLFSYLK